MATGPARQARRVPRARPAPRDRLARRDHTTGSGTTSATDKGHHKGHHRGHRHHKVAYIFRGTWKAADGSLTVTGGNAHVRKAGFVGQSVKFDLTKTRFVVADTDGDGSRTLADVKDGDQVLVGAQVAAPRPGHPAVRGEDAGRPDQSGCPHRECRATTDRSGLDRGKRMKRKAPRALIGGEPSTFLSCCRDADSSRNGGDRGRAAEGQVPGIPSEIARGRPSEPSRGVGRLARVRRRLRALQPGRSTATAARSSAIRTMRRTRCRARWPPRCAGSRASRARSS